MRSRRVLRMALALATLGSVGCDSGGGGTPLPQGEPFADPDTCDVPCEVVLDSGVEGTEAQPLSFTWDFGDGPVEGEARELHRFETAGLHSVSVTVSGANSSVTHTIEVLAEQQPKASTMIDAEGGSVSQGACTVTVPSGIAPEAFPLDVTELPSMVEASGRLLDAEQLEPLSSAFDIEMPFKSATAMDVSVTAPEAAGEAPENLAWLVRTIAKPDMPTDDRAPFPSPAPLADYTYLPVSSIDPDGTAHGQIFGRKRLQLVRLSQPLDVYTSDEGRELAEKAETRPLLITIFNDAPTKVSKADFEEAVFYGLAAAHEELVNKRGFVGPGGTMVVFVSKMPKPNIDGYVQIHDPNTIHISHVLASTDAIKKVIAHEFFHCIQAYAGNKVTSVAQHASDGWFTEGTAAWAMDEVFDDIVDHYYAPDDKRFRIPLLQPTNSASPHDVYETVAFWKWAERENETIIRRIIEGRWSATHAPIANVLFTIENGATTDYLSELDLIWSKPDFLEFTYDARYAKDFDTEEDKKGELWSKDESDKRLGRPKIVEYDVFNVLQSGKGDSETSPLKMAFEVHPRLAAQVLLLQSSELSGVLHIRFPVTQAPLDALVLVTDAASHELSGDFTVRDLSKPQDDVRLPFGEDEEAFVFMVGPEWGYPLTKTLAKGEFEAWIETPCGSAPTPDFEVSTATELQEALQTVEAGAVIKLAAGTYSPPLIQWPTPEYGPFGANLLVRDMTLIGEGAGETIIVMTGDPYRGIGLKTYGSARIQDLTIQGGEAEPIIDCLDAQQVTLCGVAIEAGPNTDYGIIWGPWNGGSTSLTLESCSLTHPNRDQMGTAVQLQSCYDPPAQVNASLSATRVSGWGIGVSYSSGPETCGTISVSPDCSGFTNNDYNVLEDICSGGSCDYIDHCP